MINVAIIGAGEIVKTFHLPAWKKIKGIKIVGIVDKKVNKAKLLAKNYKIPKAYHNIDSLYKNEKVDAVDVCTPNKQHEKDILFSLKNNKHVICEKPFVLNFKVFKKINYLAQKKKLVCVCAQHQRFRQSSINSKKLVDKNKLGSIYTAHITVIFKRSNTVKNPYFTNISTAGGGPLIDLGSHFIDLAWWIMGNPKPISVFTYTSNKLAKHLKANEKTPWKKFNVELIDMKIEIGIEEKNKELVIADVIDNDSWRIWPNGDPKQQLDKQSFRDGEALTEVQKKYRTVTRYTEKF